MLRGGLLAGTPRFPSLHLIPPSLPRPGARRRTSRPRSARASPRRPPGTCAPARASWSVPSVGRSRPQPSALQSASPSVSRFRLHRPFRQVGVASLIRVSKCRRVPCRRRGGRWNAAAQRHPRQRHPRAPRGVSPSSPHQAVERTSMTTPDYSPQTPPPGGANRPAPAPQRGEPRVLMTAKTTLKKPLVFV